MNHKQIRYFFACAFLAAALPGAHADKLDDNLQTVWESLWDQRGVPRAHLRWEQPITYRIHGANSARHREHIKAALEAATDIAKIQIIDVSQSPDTQTTAALDLEVVNDTELEDNQPCYTQILNYSAGVLTKARVKMRAKNTWNCAFHEMMQVRGIAGHPSGRTVLSYFSYRRDVFMDLDKLILAAWYSPEMRKNATPLEALVVLARAVAWQTDLRVPAEEALGRADAFKRKMLLQMEALAAGDGEVPSIVLRSGKASESLIRSARPTTAYFVGMAYFRGSLATKNPGASSPWFKRGAEKGFAPAQIMWGTALIDGTGVPVDRPAGHAWLTLAAKSIPTVNNVLATIKKKMSPEELEQARALPPPQVDPS